MSLGTDTGDKPCPEMWCRPAERTQSWGLILGLPAPGAEQADRGSWAQGCRCWGSTVGWFPSLLAEKSSCSSLWDLEELP